MENSLKQLRDNWMILTFLVVMILWYGNTNARLTAVEAQQVEQATTDEKVDKLVIDVAVIKTETKDTGKKVDGLSQKVDYIINNMRR